MSVFFVSDVHLCTKESDTVSRFLNFLRYCSKKANSLYILGDLFDQWVGDDEMDALHQEIAIGIRKLSQQHGIPCYFIHGNRDFLLGENYAINCGMTLLPTQQILTLFGYKVIILHGDILCTADTIYQLFRKYTRKKWVKKAFLSLPLSIRKSIVNSIRQYSSNHIPYIHKNHSDVNLNLVLQIMQQTGAMIMIHGHTHQPAIHTMNNLSNQHKRVVLGHWDKYGSIIEFNQYGIHLFPFPLK
ncbi:UDP-2,3-diacylglucosamine diphosphatase [Candidatus Schneideria nysicola]|uniref:UDP-2,3-diacylglucosamine diphosphatase n=1 Tax=Candidatus Schneideria nysicola TaxID=1081631 RepID=UPI001CAA461A|nr:UDP-2,3-diacylglucosamine diphosphatase [Candidatus Schneideria nysicola]UAJ66238.1 UDP-2,3-diacylglucosamine diphosphatase [Candidatus Schneideria nysicola]